MGYGKTVAVRDFLDEMKADYVWLNVESDETSAHIVWNSFYRKLGVSSRAAAVRKTIELKLI